MSEKKELELAFPLTDGQSFATNGMTKRFYAACAAMNGLLANRTILDDHDKQSIEWCATHAFLQADELLRKENE